MRVIFIFVFFTFIHSEAYAYIGPGLGAGTVSVILGLIGSIFLALFAVLWYPLKKLIKGKKKSSSDKPEKIEGDAKE